MQTKWNARPENFNLINKSPWHVDVAAAQGCVHWKWKRFQGLGMLLIMQQLYRLFKKLLGLRATRIEGQSRHRHCLVFKLNSLEFSFIICPCALSSYHLRALLPFCRAIWKLITFISVSPTKEKPFFFQQMLNFLALNWELVHMLFAIQIFLLHS